MKEQNLSKKKSFIKKFFIKICRLLGYEIIDQGNFFVPTQNKFINENLNAQGIKSINLPLGEIKISRDVKTLTVIFRSCTKVNMLTQTKKRLFDKEKSEYTFRSLNSLINSINLAKNSFNKINFELVIIDYESSNKDLENIKKILIKANFKNTIINLNINEFVNNIKNTNAKNEKVTDNQKSNMSNIHKSLLYAKDHSNDLVYFVEDDYLHKKESIIEMILTYERLSSQIKRELIICPTDYPYLYTKADPTNVFLGYNKHWRKVDETLCTFLTSKVIIEKYWDKLISMCEFEHYPFEKPLHDIYKLEFCISPIPSLALHCTNINSIYGVSPNMDWKSIWEENDTNE